MSLDLTQLAGQIEVMAERLKAREADRQERLGRALALLQSSANNLDFLREKALLSRTTWLVAGLGQGLSHAYPPPSLPFSFTVVAADGSHIDVDRHSPVRCYLINIGSAQLVYGAEPQAILASQPTLYLKEEELNLVNPSNSNQHQQIEGNWLAMTRTVAEVQALANLVEGASGPTLALFDGSLILWSLEGRDTPIYLREALLDKGLLPALDSIKASGEEIALACYISFPRSTEVVNLLRLALCPYNPADCDGYCSRKAINARECDDMANLLDRDLFAQLLAPGQRSPTFASPSKIMSHYGQHRIHFFYLRVDDEIARVEIPQWVAQSPRLMELTHALMVDQCRLGQGYPVAIAEAHERAVVTNADRDQFWHLVEMALSQRRLPTNPSGKRKSKRGRWI